MSDLCFEHVSAMTAEKLHGKSEIAAELAFRDYRIAQLEAENKALREAAKPAAKWMREWLDEGLCECEGIHICGKTERLAELEKLEHKLGIKSDGSEKQEQKA